MKKSMQVFLVLLILLAVSGCEKKSCSHVTCASYETCKNGTCLCLDGYEGDTCSVLSETKFIGNWQVNENCSPDPANFGVYYTNIYATTTANVGYYAPNVIYFNILLGSGPVYAQIINTSPSTEGVTLYIPPQNLNNGVSILGGSQGYYSAPVVSGAQPTMTITMNYSYQGNSYTCYENFHKQ